jgi:hypothetical protein
MSGSDLKERTKSALVPWQEQVDDEWCRSIQPTGRNGAMLSAIDWSSPSFTGNRATSVALHRRRSVVAIVGGGALTAAILGGCSGGSDVATAEGPLPTAAVAPASTSTPETKDTKFIVDTPQTSLTINLPPGYSPWKDPIHTEGPPGFGVLDGREFRWLEMKQSIVLSVVSGPSDEGAVLTGAPDGAWARLTTDSDKAARYLVDLRSVSGQTTVAWGVGSLGVVNVVGRGMSSDELIQIAGTVEVKVK